METILAAFYGLVIIGFILFVLVVEKYKRQAVIWQERAHHLDDILASAPEGFYCEILSQTNRHCLTSRRLCLMLNLVETSSDLETVLKMLSDTSRQELNEAWNELKKMGTAFELTVQNTLNLMHFKVRGHALTTPYGEQTAYILWFENISHQTAEYTESALKYAHLNNEKEVLEHALKTLSFPLYIRRADGLQIFTNTAQTQDELPDLHWESVSFKTAADETYRLHYGQDKTAEDKLNALLSDAERAQKLTLKEIPVAVCIFDAGTRLVFFNKTFADLWKLDTTWLRKEPLYDDFLNKMQEKGYLPQVKDFAQYKRVQKDLFAKLTKPAEDFIYLERGRLVHRHMIPHAKGGILFIDEDKGCAA